MNVNKILKTLDVIQDLVSQTRDLLFCPEGIRILAVWQDDFSYVELWDGEFTPRILFYSDEKVPIEIVNSRIVMAINAIPPFACGVKEVELHTDVPLKELSDGVMIGMEIFDVTIEPIKDQLITQTRARNDFNNYLSEFEKVRDYAESSTRRVREDNGLSDTGSSSS
jgi:hypothetical protein